MVHDIGTTVVKLTFDGGASPNPGRGYGSYSFEAADGHLKGSGSRLEFGDGITSNQAEYMALLAGLRHLLTEVELACIPDHEIQVNIYGDSKLVINQVKGQFRGGWKCKDATLIVLRERVYEILRRFGDYYPIWHSREKSVALFGH